MVLAMAVLFLQFPAATTLVNAGGSAFNDIRLTREAPAATRAKGADRSSGAAPAFSAALEAANGASGSISGPRVKLGTEATSLPHILASGANAEAGLPPKQPDTLPTPSQPSALKDENASAEPIIHSSQPPIGSIAPLTGPSFSEAILPPPAFRPPFELPAAHRRLWLFLSTAEHSAATYDAWSTRRALAAGRVEADPLMRPFAGSAALYPAMQLVPIGLDYLARRLQRSSGWAHRIWWVPQSAATVTFLFSGSYNVAHTN